MVDYSSLKSLIDHPIDCTFFDSIESTNDYLLSQPYNKATQLCVTREQTQGKGQHGRIWRSQKDGSVLFSIRQDFDSGCDLSGFSLVVALAIVKSLEKSCGIINLGIKWPNDIYFESKKLSGILLENRAHGAQQSVVIGVGVNYHLGFDLDCETPWIDLSQICNQLPTIEALTASVVNSILTYVERFEVLGFEDFQSEWQAYDTLKGRQAQVDLANGSFAGDVIGVSNKGALLISSSDGIREVFSSEHIRYNDSTL